MALTSRYDFWSGVLLIIFGIVTYLDEETFLASGFVLLFGLLIVVICMNDM